MNISERSLELHKTHKGKLAVTSLVSVNTREDLALAYTPGVAEVCSSIAKDKLLAHTYTLKSRTIAIISDGSAVLGLGNIGAEASIPVMEGKAILFKEFANLDAFPICLETQDTEEIIQIVKNIAPVFGGINLEDIAAPKCFEIEKRLKEELSIPVMHDDQHGTAVVVLAGLINSLKVTKRKKEEVRIVINGAGAAGLAVAELLLEYGFSHMILCDSQGILSTERNDLNPEKAKMAENTNPEKRTGTLADALTGADIFIGVSKGGVLTSALMEKMNRDPIIFALANPTPEIMPDVAKKAGAKIIATGRSDFPNQINNVFAFPGIFRGALEHQVSNITNTHLLKAAENLAAYVREPNEEHILPDLFDKGVVLAVAKAFA